jgi:hypothetical protein
MNEKKKTPFGYVLYQEEDKKETVTTMGTMSPMRKPLLYVQRIKNREKKKVEEQQFQRGYPDKNVHEVLFRYRTAHML